MFELARIMGTSAEMIEAHYGTLIDTAHHPILSRLDEGTQRLNVVARTPPVWSDTTLTPAAAAPVSNLSLNACWASADFEASTAAQPRNVTPSALLTSFEGCPATLMRFRTSRPGWLTTSSKSMVKTVVSTLASQLVGGTSGHAPMAVPQKRLGTEADEGTRTLDLLHGKDSARGDSK